MIEFLKSWVVNIATLSVFIVLIEILMPSGRMKKFINLVSGFILLIALLNPFIQLYAKGVNLKEIQLNNDNFINKMELEENRKIFEEKQMKQTIELYKQKLKNNIEESLKDIKGIREAKAEVEVDEDYNSNTFGEIKKVYLTLVRYKEGTEAKPAAQIEKININGSQEASKSLNAIDDGIKKEIEGKLSKTFNIESKDILISMNDK